MLTSCSASAGERAFYVDERKCSNVRGCDVPAQRTSLRVCFARMEGLRRVTGCRHVGRSRCCLLAAMVRMSVLQMSVHNYEPECTQMHAHPWIVISKHEVRATQGFLCGHRWLWNTAINAAVQVVIAGVVNDIAIVLRRGSKNNIVLGVRLELTWPIKIALFRGNGVSRSCATGSQSSRL
jgi:hypothetical protein